MILTDDLTIQWMSAALARARKEKVRKALMARAKATRPRAVSIADAKDLSEQNVVHLEDQKKREKDGKGKSGQDKSKGKGKPTAGKPKQGQSKNGKGMNSMEQTGGEPEAEDWDAQEVGDSNPAAANGLELCAFGDMEEAPPDYERDSGSSDDSGSVGGDGHLGPQPSQPVRPGLVNEDPRPSTSGVERTPSPHRRTRRSRSSTPRRKAVAMATSLGTPPGRPPPSPKTPPGPPPKTPVKAKSASSPFEPKAPGLGEERKPPEPSEPPPGWKPPEPAGPPAIRSRSINFGFKNALNAEGCTQHSTDVGAGGHGWRGQSKDSRGGESLGKEIHKGTTHHQ